jgi:hypothetical protein
MSADVFSAPPGSGLALRCDLSRLLLIAHSDDVGLARSGDSRPDPRRMRIPGEVARESGMMSLG